MANIKSFTISNGTSDFTATGGITIRGSFSTQGYGSINNINDIEMRVNEGGTIKVLQGTWTFDTFWQTYKFVSTPAQLTAAGVTGNDQIKFLFVDKNGNGTADDVTLTTSSTYTVCFYPGTMIATPDGEKAVETLAIGDKVLRHDGTEAVIRWMGQNTINMFFADKQKTLPIRIKKGAFAENVPSRDLLVSPDHAMFVDGILAQAGALVNGTSIVQETNVPEKFTYHHIELEEHALIVAENAPTESFVDNIDRMAYDNWAEHEALYGDLPALVEMDLPRAKSQRQVPAAIRKALADRAVALGYSEANTAAA